MDQSTISGYITFLTPLIDAVTAEFRPSAEDAAEATRGAIALVDGTLLAVLVLVRRAGAVGREIQRQPAMARLSSRTSVAVLSTSPTRFPAISTTWPS